MRTLSRQSCLFVLFVFCLWSSVTLGQSPAGNATYELILERKKPGDSKAEVVFKKNMVLDYKVIETKGRATSTGTKFGAYEFTVKIGADTELRRYGNVTVEVATGQSKQIRGCC